MLRIAVGGIHTECSTYSPVLMTPEDFRILRGEALTADPYFAFLPGDGVEIRALLHARAVPGGPVGAATYAGFRAEFLDCLRAALPLDGVYLAMHGAMHVDGMQDAEGDWTSAVREIVGPAIPIAASYDLHGNLSQRIIDALDIFSAYRTAPHIDVRETMEAAWAMLLRHLRGGGARPGIAWAPVPLLLPGERSSTEDEPARSLYAALPALDARPGIWKSDLMIGYVWADEPRATAAAVVTGTDRAAALAAAEEIASAFWAARDAFRFGPVTGPLPEMLDRAAGATTAPVILADSGDNPTGGGVGDRADVLAALIARGWQGALVAGITDAPAVEACFAAGEGATLALTIGASLDPAGVSVRTEVRVLRLDDAGTPSGRQAVVAIGEGITLVLAARRRPYHDIADFTRLGLDPAGARLLVVKSGYLSPELAPLARPNLMALTEGVVNQDIASLPNRHRAPGTLPFQPNPGSARGRSPPPASAAEGHHAPLPSNRSGAAGRAGRGGSARREFRAVLRRSGLARPTAFRKARMMSFLAILRRYPVARVAAAGILLFGFAGAATSPYQPVVAIRELGMSNAAYSVVIFAAAVANVLASILIGLLADRRASYRRPILVATGIGALGFATIYLMPSALVFALVAVGPLAIYGASNALIFAKVRSHATEFTRADGEAVGALLRMMISLAWILVPGAVGLLLAGGDSMLPAYLISAVLALAGLAILAALPADLARQPGTPRAGIGDLFAFANPGLVLRVAGVALASSVLHVNSAVLPLIVTGRAGGTVADVGVIVGYVALVEVVFIFVWAAVCRRLSMQVALVLCMALYLAYLLGLATARAMPQVHAASLLGGVAAAAIITLPIPYLLGLIAGRPGLSASLIAVNHFVGAGIGAGIFALGTALGGYQGAAILAGLAGVLGGLLLLVLDGWRRQPMVME